MLMTGIIASAKSYGAAVAESFVTFVSDLLTGATPYTPVNMHIDTGFTITKIRKEAYGPAVFGGGTWDTLYVATYVNDEVLLNGVPLFALAGIVSFDLDFDNAGYPVVSYELAGDVYIYDAVIYLVEDPDYTNTRAFYVDDNIDISDDAVNGVIAGGVTTGLLSGESCLIFDGATGRMRTDQLLPLVPTKDFSVTFDVYVNSGMPVWGAIFAINGNINASNNVLIFGVEPDGLLIDGLGTMPLNQWTSFAIVSGPVEWILYKNGVLYGVGVNLAGDWGLAESFNFGAETDTTGGSYGNFLSGGIKNIRVFDRQLTLAEIEVLAGATVGPISMDSTNPFIVNELPEDGNAGLVVSYQKGGLWTPDDLPFGADIWLDGESGFDETAGAIDEWFNAGSALTTRLVYDASLPAGSQRPTLISGGLNGYDVVRFNGSSQRMGLLSSLTVSTTSMTAFIVFKRDSVVSGPEQMFIVYTGDGAAQYRFFVGMEAGTGLLYGYCDVPDGGSSRLAGSQSYSQGAWMMIMFEMDTADESTFIYDDDDTDTRSYAPVTGSPTGPLTASGWDGFLGGSSSGVAFTGDIALFSFFDSNLISDQDKTNLFGWAANKYGLQANLPIEHPNKIDPPRIPDSAAYKLSHESYATERTAANLTGGGVMQGMGMVDDGAVKRLAMKFTPPAAEV